MQIVYAPFGIDEDVEKQISSLIGELSLLKNMCKDYRGHLIRGEYSDPDSAVCHIDELNQRAGKEKYGFCFDVGTANICGQNLYDFVVTMGSRLKVVVLRENDGVSNSSFLPFTIAPRWKSLTDWPNLILGLRKINFNNLLVVNYRNNTLSYPIQLRPYLDELAKATGEYFKWQIEMELVLAKYSKRVLFGAGNMCHNYLKHYGKKYPAIFTCDNNPKLWGSSIAGLEVKNPEELKNIDEDYVIFICNIHYKEIEQQLFKMGIRNRVEYFNDVYLPSIDIHELEAGENCWK